MSSVTFILIYPIFLAFHISRVVIIRYGILLFGILFIKYLFDMVNMTLLRSL
ncbi:hypothetical protein [Mesoplasma melaleucae]|uniref:hypothetical protein n=1 Tax=Mesoplasma melaleucae TaxID=81459 RepID=UPI000AD2FE7E|nr:hypothetical protein [Mesoplasma melaleucae]